MSKETIGTAHTLEELAVLVAKAIEKFGKDSRWYGWDDGAIVIQKNGQDVAFIESTIYTQSE